MQVPNSDFYNISVGGAHKGFFQVQFCSPLPLKFAPNYWFFLWVHCSTILVGRRCVASKRYMHVWYIGTKVVYSTLYLASFIFNDNLIASMKRCCQWQSIAYIFLAWNLSSFHKEVTNKKKYKLLFDPNFTYDVLFPSFFSKKCIQFIYFMILGVIFIARNLRCGSAQRGYHPWVFMWVFFFIISQYVIITCRWSIIECTNQSSQ